MAAIDDEDVIEYKNEVDHIWEEETNFTSYDNPEIYVKSEVDTNTLNRINEEANCKIKETVVNVNNIEISEASVSNVKMETTEKTDELEGIAAVDDKDVTEYKNEADHLWKEENIPGDELHSEIPVPEGIPYCERCDLSFASQEAFVDHTTRSAEHADERTVKIIPRFTEPVFFNGVQFAKTLRVELWKYNTPPEYAGMFGEKPYSCTVCNKYFSSSSHLKSHMRIHTGEKPYSCTVCNKQFNRSGNLKTHMRTHTGEKPYSCTVCNKQFDQSSNLKIHILIHTGEKPYLCTVCKKQFNSSGNLKKHMRMHTGEKPYSCTVCNKQFSHSSSDLNRHMRTHTGEKPYSCTVCNKQFSINGHLKAHMRKHTGEKPYSCTVCNKQFSRNGCLKRHMRTHTGEKPYSCKVCRKKFNQSSSLSTHLETHTSHLKETKNEAN